MTITNIVNKPKKIITSWKDIPYGEYYLLVLNQQLKLWWPKIFGFYLLKIGNFSAQIDTTISFINKQYSINTVGDNFQLHGNPHYMPFKNKCIDVCLLMQELSYTNHPYWLLREIDRILIDDGWLIISNYNLISILGIAKCCPFLRKKEPYKHKMFSIWKQLQWLKLLNYQVIYKKSFQKIPYIHANNIINNCMIYTGCITLLIARKRTFPINKISSNLIQKKSMIKLTNIFNNKKYFFN
uniref:Class I SAM-dependent methyltransferase n=1 Tax=Candidatus Aschnera chinzeii TaxID=1485666 RepID=A0AAT9G4R5_9ENTR|nr:MAG: class I SAM-dependent methyltransferase [Candidatus Aschnera chinzeii]